jgi:hypothetical protein
MMMAAYSSITWLNIRRIYKATPFKSDFAALPDLVIDSPMILPYTWYVFKKLIEEPHY